MNPHALTHGFKNNLQLEKELGVSGWVWWCGKEAAFAVKTWAYQSQPVSYVIYPLCGLGLQNPLTFLGFPHPQNENNLCLSLCHGVVMRQEHGVAHGRTVTIPAHSTRLFAPLSSRASTPPTCPMVQRTAHAWVNHSSWEKNTQACHGTTI